jgi:prepilin-type N-terminal cleavage/methylation domain-containing protein
MIRLRLRPAFTLVELLVVIAILSLLLAILLPSLSAAREQAKNTLCLTHVREIARAWGMYLDENNGHFLRGAHAPVAYGGGQGSSTSSQVSKPLNDYIGLPREASLQESTVFQCPFDTGGPAFTPTAFEFYGTSYETNFFLAGQSNPWFPSSDPCREDLDKAIASLPGLRRTTVAKSSTQLLVADVGWRYNYLWWAEDRADWHKEECQHSVGFLDGGAESLTIQRGMHVTPDYQVIPFGDLHEALMECQEQYTCSGEPIE